MRLFIVVLKELHCLPICLHVDIIRGIVSEILAEENYIVYQIVYMLISLTLGTHAQQGLRWYIPVYPCVCVCLSVTTATLAKALLGYTPSYRYIQHWNGLVDFRKPSVERFWCKNFNSLTAPLALMQQHFA